MLLLLLLSLSCEESFSPKEEDFKEQYVLFGKIYDANVYKGAIVKLLKSYNVEGLNPYDKKSDNQIRKADVVLTCGNREYKMVEDTIVHTAYVDIRYRNFEIDYMHSGQVYTVRQNYQMEKF